MGYYKRFYTDSELKKRLLEDVKKIREEEKKPKKKPAKKKKRKRKRAGKSGKTLEEKQEFAQKMRETPTKAEAALWEFLKTDPWQLQFESQVVLLGWIVDFLCRSRDLIIEVDGPYHKYGERKRLDKKKDRSLKRAGYDVLRLSNWLVLKNIEKAKEIIEQALEKGVKGMKKHRAISFRMEREFNAIDKRNFPKGFWKYNNY